MSARVHRVCGSCQVDAYGVKLDQSRQAVAAANADKQEAVAAADAAREQVAALQAHHAEVKQMDRSNANQSLDR